MPAASQQGRFSHTDHGKSGRAFEKYKHRYLPDGLPPEHNATTGLVQAETVNQIIFQDVDHPEKCVTLEVDDTIFSTLKEGEQGKLTFRDRRLLSFGALQSQNHKDYKFKGIS